MSDTISFISVVAIFVISMAVIYWLKRKFNKMLLEIGLKLLDEYSSWRRDDFAQIKKLKAELDSLSIVNRDLVDSSREQLGKRRDEILNMQRTIKGLWNDKDALQTTISELKGKLFGANQEIEQLKAQIKTPSNLIHQGDYDLLKKEYDLTTKNMVQWMTKCTQLEAEIAELKTNDYDYLEEVNSNLLDHLAQERSRVSQMNHHVRNLLAENSTLKLQLTGMAGMRSQIMFAVDDTLKQKSASLDLLKQKHAEEIATLLKEWEENIQQKDAEIAHLKQVLSDTVTTLDERYSSIVQENEKLQTDVRSWKEEYELLEGKCKKYAGWG